MSRYGIRGGGRTRRSHCPDPARPSSRPGVRDVTASSEVARTPGRVVVVLGVPHGQHYPQLSAILAEAIAGEPDREIGVQVEYVQTEDPVDG